MTFNPANLLGAILFALLPPHAGAAQGAPGASGTRLTDVGVDPGEPLDDFEVVAGSRFTFLAPTGDGAELFQIDDPGALASYRFTAKQDAEIESVWLFYGVQGQPDSMTLSIKDDDGTLRPVAGGVNESVHFAAGTGATPAWREIGFPPGLRKALVRGRVYHLVLEPSPQGTDYDADDHVVVATSRSRHPMQFVPRGPHTDVDLRMPRDEALAFMFDAADGNGLLAQRANFASFTPIFALRATSGDILGQPYDSLEEFKVAETDWFGQVFTPPTPVTIDHVAMYVRAAGINADPRPSDDLFLEIYEEDGNGGKDKLLGPLKVIENEGEIYRGRSHWFGVKLPTRLELAPGVSYVFAVQARDCATGEDYDGYVFSLAESTLPLPANKVPTYLGNASHSVRSFDSGGTFQSLGESTDAPFMLGLHHVLVPPPVGYHDESGRVNGYPAMACPGELIDLDVLARNVGATSRRVRLFARLIDLETEEVMTAVNYPLLQANDETPRSLIFKMPDRDLLLRLEIGHRIDEAMIVDDRVPFEIRLDPGCP